MGTSHSGFQNLVHLSSLPSFSVLQINHLGKLEPWKLVKATNQSLGPEVWLLIVYLTTWW